MHHKEKKIPTILALFILVTGITGTVFLNQTTRQNDSIASLSQRPDDVHFSNVSYDAFTATWFTANPTTGSIIIQDNGRKISVFEDMDSDNILRPRTTHLVTVKNLKENSSYKVKIVSGDPSCKLSENCPEFVQNTANRIINNLNLPAARGSVILPDGKPAIDAMVYLSVGKSSLLSGKTDSLGLWVIPFGNLRTSDLLSRPNLADNDIVQITAKINPDKKAEAVTDIKSVRQNLTIPPLEIGKSYNFIDLISKKDMLANLNKTTDILGTQTQSKTPANVSSLSTAKSIEILFPRYDDDTTTDNQPRFRGMAPAKSQLILIVNSSPQTAKVLTDPDGTWNWRPPSPLDPGVHHLGVSGFDENKNMINLSRRFIVLKSGEQVLGEATASATLTPTLSLIPSPTITLIPIKSPTPSVTLIPVNNPSAIPISTTPIVPPKTGSTQSTILFMGAGASLLLLGLKFFLLP